MTPWRLFTRPPLAAADYVRCHTVLLGDAAHPLLPYLAQGGAMALEDAWGLASSLAASPDHIQSGLQAYAKLRAGRNARVVNRSKRIGQIFHATGLMKWGRDMALKAFGTRVMDVSWLYKYQG